ncbi:MAG: hypothetical protein CM15mP84_02450 [Cellvibrionales bacterium]|nr:MAG: hypothetical protein CM15mP84_02450 [Cellvibrionales bacterium]
MFLLRRSDVSSEVSPKIGLGQLSKSRVPCRGQINPTPLDKIEALGAVANSVYAVTGPVRRTQRNPSETFYKSVFEGRIFTMFDVEDTRDTIANDLAHQEPDFITASRNTSPCSAITSSGSWIVNSQSRGLLLSTAAR